MTGNSLTLSPNIKMIGVTCQIKISLIDLSDTPRSGATAFNIKFKAASNNSFSANFTDKNITNN